MIAWLAGLAATFFTASVARWLAWKFVMLTLFGVVLPIVVSNIIYKILEKAIALASSSATTAIAEGQVAPISVQLTGLAGWLGSVLKLPEAFGLLMGAVILKITLGMIPFVRLGGR